MRQNVRWVAAILVGLAVATLGLGFFWGFTVDDAWIVTRVAHHGLSDGGFSFNLGSEPTDAVTPLGFAQLIALIGRMIGAREPLELFSVARWFGLLCSSISVLFLGLQLVRRAATERGGPARLALFAILLAVNVPFLAWTGAGLAGPIVGLAVAIGSWRCDEREGGLLGPLLLGMAASWRPELVCFGALVCVGRNGRPARSLSLFVLAASAAPIARWALFGSPVPLAAVAKAPEFESGLRYALGTLAFAGPFLAVLLLPGAHARHDGRWGWGWIVWGHLAALVFAGGDWMAFYRLSVPIIPTLAYVVSRDALPGWRSGFGVILSLALSLVLLVLKGPQARDVLQERTSWIRQGEPLLRGAEVVAAVDVGWLGIATQAQIVDLAGVTDPSVAPLPGGHTSKLVPPALLSARGVDAWVIRVPPLAEDVARLQDIVAIYAVDARLLRDAEDLGFALAGRIEGRGGHTRYIVARYRP